VDLPACLIHGDLHAGNLLRDAEGASVWADWQEVGIGQGPEDLALLWQRAEFDGADRPAPPCWRRTQPRAVSRATTS
jgi:aminoglycoside phosphotransferase (APT) family kinase protein